MLTLPLLFDIISFVVRNGELNMRVWRNRQTRTFEGRVVIPYGFKSHHSHQKADELLVCLLFLFLPTYSPRDLNPLVHLLRSTAEQKGHIIVAVNDKRSLAFRFSHSHQKADELLVCLLFIFTNIFSAGLEPVSPSFAKHGGAKGTYALSDREEWIVKRSGCFARIIFYIIP